jgi:hypothetical protein
MYKVGEFLPDLPVFENPGATVAKNVLPFGKSYKKAPSSLIYSNALDARCMGAFSTKDSSGNTVNFAADSSTLYKMTTASYADVSKSGGYTTAADDMWYFTRFDNLLLATNFGDAIQQFDVDSGSAFSDLAATAPKARFITTVRRFVFVGNTFDSTDGNKPSRVRWSQIDDPTAAWTVSSTTLADYQDLDPSKGWVQQVVGGEYGIILQEFAITRATFIGSPAVWQFDEVESNKGTQAPGSVVKVGGIIFYLGLDGFYAFDGNQSIPIGANKVDKMFFSEVDTGYWHKICACADPDNQLIYWGYAASGNTDGRLNTILVYNYSPNAELRWSKIEGQDLEYLYVSLSEGYTMEQLDDIYPDLDAMPISLDSRSLTGNNRVLSGFDSSHRQVNFTSDAMDATIETGEFQVNPGARTDITLVRPYVDGGTVTVQMGTRNLHSDTVSYASAVSLNSSGDAPVRSNARFHRVRLNITGEFTDAQGVDILKSTKVGER